MCDDGGLEHAEDPAIRELLNTLLLLMIKDEYDEIGIRPVGGELQLTADFDDLVAPGRYVLAGIVDRLKVMAELDLGLTDREQRGRFSLEIKQRVIQLRVTTLPSDEGEGVLVTREG